MRTYYASDKKKREEAKRKQKEEKRLRKLNKKAEKGPINSESTPSSTDTPGNVPVESASRNSSEKGGPTDAQ